jgi:hypothetical protein
MPFPPQRSLLSHGVAPRDRGAGHSLATLAALLLALSGAGLSSASLTSATTNPGNSFSAGSLVISDSDGGGAILGAIDLRPGLSAAGTVMIANTGTVGAQLSLSLTDLSDSPSSPALASVLDLELVDATSGQTLYNGALGSLSSVGLGELGVGAARKLRITVSWPASQSSSALQGASAAFKLIWTAST